MTVCSRNLIFLYHSADSKNFCLRFFKETSYCFIDLLKRPPIPIKVIGIDSFQLTKSHFSFNKFIREHLFPTSNALFYPLVAFHVAFRKKKKKEIVTATLALLLASSAVENTAQNIQ